VSRLLAGLRAEAEAEGVHATLRLVTNGVYVDRDWARLFQRLGVHVAISVNGPPDIHDATRPLPDGLPSSAHVERSAAVLREAGIDIACLAVVTSQSVGHARRITEYLGSLGFGAIGFLPCIDYGPTITPDEYGAFLCDAFEVWAAATDEARIRDFARLVSAFTLGRPPTADICTFGRRCPVCPVLCPDGSLYACETWIGREPGLLGNVERDSLEDILRSRRVSAFVARVCAVPTACSDCEFLWLCRGGCVYLQESERLPDRFCPAYRRLFHLARHTISRAHGGLPQAVGA
jgi:uncharacterized protein